MAEHRSSLERVQRRVRMPEPAMDRLLARRERKRRNERIATIAVALVIAALGIGSAVAALQVSPAIRPAARRVVPEPASDAGGALAEVVVPAVAAWAGIAVLGLVVVALVRLAPRLATGREGSMGTHVERMPTSHPSRTAWTVIGALVLLAAAVGAGVLVGRESVSEPSTPAAETTGLAPADVVATIDAGIAATVAGDEAALVSRWVDDGVFTDMIAGVETVGAEEIAAAYARGDMTSLRRTSEVIQAGDYVANAFEYAAAAGSGSGIAILLLDDELKIVHQWVIGN